jgi:hypothetical protein
MDTGNGNDGAVRDESKHSEVGDIEEAGETTAADTITGPINPKPVGADTMLKVSGEPGGKGRATRSDPEKP